MVNYLNNSSLKYMKKTILSLLAFLAITPVFAQLETTMNPSTKIYVATEKAGKIAIINGDTQEVIKSVDLSQTVNGERLSYMAHNVQVSPDGKTVWITANAGEHDEHDEKADTNHSGSTDMTQNMDAMSMSGMTDPIIKNDEVIVLNTENDIIINRISLAPKSHLAHVVFTPDNRFAYITAQEASVIYKIDIETYAAKKIDLPGKSGPHGLRIDPAGKKAYIALLAGKGLGILDIANDTVTIVPLDGAAVQTAVLPNGKWVFVSLYDTKKIAAYNTDTKKIIYVNLPKTSQGPVQLYPAPDGSALYIADQGYLFGRAVNTRIYKFDFIAHKIKTIIA